MTRLWCLTTGHNWQILDVTYSAPQKYERIPDFWHDFGRWALEKTVHGCTTYLLKCDQCGMVDKKECLGQQSSLRQMEAHEQQVIR